MVYRLRKWWLLKKLNERIETHSLEQELSTIIGDRVLIGEPHEGFYDWVSRESERRFWPVLWFRLRWKLPFLHYPENKLKKIARTNKLIIRRCIEEKEIELHDGKGGIDDPPIPRLIITPLGYQFMDDFWYKSIFENSIVKLVIATALTVGVTLFVTWQVGKLINPKENKVQQIQIIPPPNETIIK